ncbi:hypothetical protein LINPERHAP1_LOCUS37623 [Linum perenne]
MEPLSPLDLDLIRDDDFNWVTRWRSEAGEMGFLVHDGHGSYGRGAVEPWRHGSCSLGATAAEYLRQSRCDGGRRINDGKAAAASKLGVVEGTRNADQIHNTTEKESNQKWQLPPLR